MYDLLQTTELFTGLGLGQMQRLSSIGRLHSLRTGEYLFLLGDSAECVSAIVRGHVDLCFPLSMGGAVKDIAIETLGPGKTIGWSALVRPFQFTLSARAADPADIIAFARHDLLRLFDEDPEIARVVLSRVSELVAVRLTTFQAMWARELQRTLEAVQLAAAR